jgi:hypothetical protein
MRESSKTFYIGVTLIFVASFVGITTNTLSIGMTLVITFISYMVLVSLVRIEAAIRKEQ